MIATVKPQPKLAPNQTARECSKCGGTGFWCRGFVDDRPVSNTGFDCYPCNGTGWIVTTKVKGLRLLKDGTVRCPRCKCRVKPEEIDGHSIQYQGYREDGTFGVTQTVICKA